MSTENTVRSCRVIEHGVPDELITNYRRRALFEWLDDHDPITMTVFDPRCIAQHLAFRLMVETADQNSPGVLNLSGNVLQYGPASPTYATRAEVELQPSNGRLCGSLKPILESRSKNGHHQSFRLAV